MAERHVFVALPNGQMAYAPESMPLDQVYAANGIDPSALQPQTPQGKRSDFIDDVQRGVGGLVGGIGSSLRDTPFSGVGESLQGWGNQVVQNNPADYNSISDIHGLGDLVGFGVEKFAENAPLLAGGLAAGALTGGSGAAATLGGLSFAQQYGDTRQAQRDKGIDDKGRALMTALPAAALDTFTGGEGAVVRSIAGEALEKAGTSLLKRIGKTAAEEGVTEVAQQGLQRYGQYDDLASPEAFDEYATAGLAGGLVGGAVGGALHPFTKTRTSSVDDNTPTNLLERGGYDRRDTWTGPQTRPTALPSPEEAARYDYQYRRNQLTPEEQQQTGMGRFGREDARPLSAYAFEQSPEGTQGNLFGFPDVQRESDTLAPKVEGTAPTEVQRDPAQLDMFEENPTSTVRTGFTQGDILKQISGGKADGYSVKLSTQLANLLYQNKGMEANRFLDEAQSQLETADLKPKALESRIAALNAAREVVNQYGQQMTQGYAAEAMNRPSAPGVVINSEPSALTAQVQQAQDAQTQQQAQAQEAEAHQMRMGDVREQTLADILEHADPRKVVPEFIKFLASGKGEYGEVGLRDNERAMLEQARELRRKREDVRRAVDSQNKEQQARETKKAQGEQRRQAMEQRFQNEKSQRETAKQLAKTEAAREEVPVAPQAEPAPTLDELMARAKPEAPAPTGTVLDRAEGPTPKVKTEKATVADKIKEKVAKRRAERKASPKVETQAMKPVPKAEPKDDGKSAEKNAEPDEVTYDSVLKEADSYLDRDGESGLLKPKEYQQLSILAEQGKVEPQALKDMLDKTVERRREKAFEEATQGKGAAFIRKSKVERERDDPVSAEASARQVEIARQTGSAHAMLDELAKRPGAVGEAARLMRDISTDVKVKVLSRAEMQKRYGSRTVEGFYDGLTDTIYISADLYTTDVITHEMAHAMTFYHIEDKTEIGRKLDRLFGEFNKVRGLSESYGFKNTHEFVAEIWRSPEFRDELRQRYAGEGKTVDKLDGLVKEPETLWDKFKSILRDMFEWFFEKDAKSQALGSPKEAADKIMQVMRLTAESVPARIPDDVREMMGGEALFEINRKKVEERIEKLPDAVKDPAYGVWHTLTNAAKKGVTWAAFTEDLMDMAGNLIPSTKPYANLMQSKGVLQEKLDRELADITDEFHKLEPKYQNMGPGTVNGVIQEMNNAKAWGFEPTWLTEKGVDVEIDPDMARKFNALPKRAQDIVKRQFEHSYKLLQLRKQVATENVVGSMDALIKSAEDRGDTDLATDLRDDRKRALAEINTLLSIDEDKPYASTRRYGNYVVIAKSAEMRQAIADNDTKLIEKLKADEDHYFVNMYDTIAEAESIARKLRSAGVHDNVVAREADKVNDELVGGREMMMAFQRLKSLVKSQVVSGDINERILSGMNRMATHLYITSLKSTSSRKAELRRIGVAGGDMDMMRNFVTQGRADSHFIGSMMYNEQIVDALRAMKSEASADTNADPAKAMRIYNEIALRHIAGMNYTPNALVDKVKAATSLYFLTTSPAYYLQNLTQYAALTAPYIAAKHGYNSVLPASLKAYSMIAKIWGGGLTDALDLDSIPDVNVRRAVEELANRGAIDIGMDKEIGEFQSLSKSKFKIALSRADSFLRNLTRKAESINRVVTATVAYQLESEALSKRGDLTPEQIHEQAIEYAYRVNRLTNGTYDGFNAPRFMRTPVGSTVTQFKKFQLMQLSLLGRLVNNSFAGMTADERLVARKALGYTMGHTALLAGAMGLPGMAAIEWFLNTFLLGDDDEPGDLEESLRDAIGDETMANLILKGAPTLGGVDMSNRVGMGSAMSVLPFTDLEPSKQGYANMVTAMMGPAIGGLGLKAASGVETMREGNYWRGLEQLVPSGIGNASAAIRERTQGVTKRNGDVLLSPEDLSYLQTVSRAMGVQTTEVEKRYRLTNEQYEQTKFYDRRAQEVNRAFAKAYREHDAQGMDDARAEFRALQAARVKNGLSRQPMSTLVRYAKAQRERERATVRGVQYKPKSPQLREALAEETEE